MLLREKRRSGRLLDLTESNPTKVGLEYPSHWLERLADREAIQREAEALAAVATGRAMPSSHGTV